jgi:hypothetical protein
MSREICWMSNGDVFDSFEDALAVLLDLQTSKNKML